MRPFVLLIVAVASSGGCRHATHSAGSGCEQGTTVLAEPSAVEERCGPPGAELGGSETVCPPEVAQPPRGSPVKAPASRVVGGRSESCRPSEIHVNVPAPKVIVRREESAAPRSPAAAPRPGNEVMLVPTTVYVPYARMTPRGPATMLPLEMTPGAPAPVSVPGPPPGNPSCAPGAPNTPACAPNAPACAPGATGTSDAQTIDALNRRCGALETKIDALIDAIKNRPNR